MSMGSFGPTNTSPGDIIAIDTNVDAILAVTNALPDAGALTSIAQEATLDGVGTEVAEIDGHIHNVARAWGSNGAATETNAITATVAVPFVAISGNNTWGTAIPICGTGDNPVLAGMTHFDPHEVLVVDTDHATPYRMRLIYGSGTSGDAITAGQWSEIMFITATGPFLSGVEVPIRMPPLTVGTKLWAQVWSATNLSNVDFYWKAHGYPAKAGV